MRAVGALSAVALLVACSSPAQSPTARELLAERHEAAPAEAVAVPTTIPAGYRLAFAPGHFLPPRGEAGIHVCALPVGADPVGRCVGTADDSPWFSTTTVNGDLQVVVQTTTGGATERDLDPWRQLVYTSDLTGVAWLDRSRDG